MRSEIPVIAEVSLPTLAPGLLGESTPSISSSRLLEITTVAIYTPTGSGEVLGVGIAEIRSDMSQRLSPPAFIASGSAFGQRDLRFLSLRETSPRVRKLRYWANLRALGSLQLAPPYLYL